MCVRGVFIGIGGFGLLCDLLLVPCCCLFIIVVYLLFLFVEYCYLFGIIIHGLLIVFSQIFPVVVLLCDVRFCGDRISVVEALRPPVLPSVLQLHPPTPLEVTPPLW